MKPGAEEYSEWSCTDGGFPQPAALRAGDAAGEHRERLPRQVRAEAAGRRSRAGAALRVLLDRSYYTTEGVRAAAGVA